MSLTPFCTALGSGWNECGQHSSCAGSARKFSRKPSETAVHRAVLWIQSRSQCVGVLSDQWWTVQSCSMVVKENECKIMADVHLTGLSGHDGRWRCSLFAMMSHHHSTDTRRHRVFCRRFRTASRTVKRPNFPGGRYICRPGTLH